MSWRQKPAGPVPHCRAALRDTGQKMRFCTKCAGQSGNFLACFNV